LQPALEWLAGDVGRRFCVTVRLECTGDLEDVPDRHRTCVYRIVQEALTNCARHAQATSALVTVARRGNALELSVRDDGRGIDPIRRRAGLGLRGMEERVKELEGRMLIESGAGAGTLLVVHLPVPLGEVPRASIAG
jgi:signal transduction histidine kinase